MRRALALVLAYALAYVPAFAAMQKFGGTGAPLPTPFFHNAAPAFNATTLVIDASAEKIAFCGRFSHKDGTTKNVNKIVMRFAGVTKGAGTDHRWSLQDIGTADANPDGVVDQSALVGNANIVANIPFELTLGASRSTAPGAALCVVAEYSTFVAGDSITYTSMSVVGGSQNAMPGQAYARLFTASWAGAAVHPLVVLGCDDGTYGTLEAAVPWSAVNSHTINTGTTPDEVALELSAPSPIVINTLWAHVDADGDFDLVLYEGTTAVPNGSCSIDKDQRHSATAQTFRCPTPAHVTLSKNTTYYVAVKPTTATSLTAYSFDVTTAAHLQAQEGGTAFRYAERTDAGAWSTTTTRRLAAGVYMIGFDDGAGGVSSARVPNGM